MKFGIQVKHTVYDIILNLNIIQNGGQKTKFVVFKAEIKYNCTLFYEIGLS